MIVFRHVMLRIKKTISGSGENRRIYDKDIAQALGLKPEYFAVIKKRGKIPYEAIVSFCHAKKISINWILLGQGEREC